MDLRITVPCVGTCAGKATLVDESADPIGYHLREALRLLEECELSDDRDWIRRCAITHVDDALERWKSRCK